MAQRDTRITEMHGRLLNWARWACGGAGLALETRSGLGEPIEADAREVESALLEMRIDHDAWYEATLLRYRNRWMDQTCAEQMAISVSTYRNMMRCVYAWLDGHLARRAA